LTCLGIRKKERDVIKENTLKKSFLDAVNIFNRRRGNKKEREHYFLKAKKLVDMFRILRKADFLWI
jgi:gluconate kinase